MLKFAFEVQFSQCCHQRFAATSSGVIPAPSYNKYKLILENSENFRDITDLAITCNRCCV